MERFADHWWNGIHEARLGLDALALEGERIWPPPGVAAEEWAQRVGFDVYDDVSLAGAVSNADTIYRSAYAMKRNLEDRLARRVGGGRFPYGGTIYSVKQSFRWEPVDLDQYVRFVGSHWPRTLTNGWHVAVTKFTNYASQRGYAEEVARDTFLKRVATSEPRLTREARQRAPKWVQELPEGEVWQPKKEED